MFDPVHDLNIILNRNRNNSPKWPLSQLLLEHWHGYRGAFRVDPELRAKYPQIVIVDPVTINPAMRKMFNLFAPELDGQASVCKIE